jgi:hypothetical protein
MYSLVMQVLSDTLPPECIDRLVKTPFLKAYNVVTRLPWTRGFTGVGVLMHGTRRR